MRKFVAMFFVVAFASPLFASVKTRAEDERESSVGMRVVAEAHRATHIARRDVLYQKRIEATTAFSECEQYMTEAEIASYHNHMMYADGKMELAFDKLQAGDVEVALGDDNMLTGDTEYGYGSPAGYSAAYDAFYDAGLNFQRAAIRFDEGTVFFGTAVTPYGFGAEREYQDAINVCRDAAP